MSIDKDAGGKGRGESPNPSGSTTAPASPGRRPLKSKKLDRTLHELENAFASWEKITAEEASGQKTQATERATNAKPGSGPDKPEEQNDIKKSEQLFRKRTRQLLNELRDQIADLSKE
jgi:hypothetical protein